MNFTYKLARRLARLKAALARIVAAAPAAAVRCLSHVLRSANTPTLGIGFTTARDARLRRPTRDILAFGPFGVFSSVGGVR
jgi:hypothetical protein